jgi:phosphoribosylaminoimidazole-succinocarboxamide synthase
MMALKLEMCDQEKLHGISWSHFLPASTSRILFSRRNTVIDVVVETNLPNLIHRGKVRDTYDLGEGLMLMVATDRLSAFDVVLPTAIPHKGLILSRLSSFWFRETSHICLNHFVGMADDLETLAECENLTDLASLPPEIARQSMIVRRAQRIDVECIVRGYLAGSAWAEYSSNGTVCGMPMSPGLLEGGRLPRPIFTPTTKADEGHDESMTFQEVVDLVGQGIAKQLESESIAVYSYAHDYARRKGIILADTKLEFGLLDGVLILIDELITPDSSRFWDAEKYQPGRSQPNFDKQYVRDWLTSQGWDQEPPAPSLPDDVVRKTSDRYTEVFRLLTGQDLCLEER